MASIKPLYYKIALFFAVLILVFYFALIIVGDNGLQDLKARKHELKKISAKNERVRQENVEIYRKIDRLKNDPEYMESVAREELKMIGKDEIVFEFENTNKTENNNTVSDPETASTNSIKSPSKKINNNLISNTKH